MRALKRYVAAVLVLSVVGGLLPIQAFAYSVERVCDSDGYCYRRIIHDDGTVTTVDDNSRYYSNYDYYPYRTYSYGYSPYYSGSDYYYDRPYYRRGGVGAAGVIGAAALGYTIGRHHR